ncbi:Uncharacterised protein (plasmid) [Tsukamurella tyrosinosolvens]|uniref:Uncharacterized protein n=1 Tax=Tsukamurella tyrosinosolvens TaxID=57704 RepID=A0A1H4V4R8_TSUTY|nr:hypothetical protein [Tsukamurella tyrosinosolvens]KXO91046.1 hypothetical protein AXK58_21690 [Tsukamurella tyrosinosolvens]SEC76089.1 hypothetical protein SAMN04489793_3144 [Tsukamurella tyrosinosolvens]VEH90680.1 Uncharacterised protein [Tsukamurella tyrosinosolvens]
MRTGYSRGNVTLTVEEFADSSTVTFTITRTAPLTDDEVRRVNAELADYPAAHGAQLERVLVDTDEWQVRSRGLAVALDHGDPLAELRWEARA